METIFGGQIFFYKDRYLTNSDKNINLGESNNPLFLVSSFPF